MKNRIKGIWGCIKEIDPFCQRFAKTPNQVACEADVLVCTSVIGAGFSITQHFQSFWAFLFTNVLTQEDKQQFTQRLRFLVNDLPNNAIRDSYIYIEKGYGGRLDYQTVLSDYEKVRSTLMASETYAQINRDNISQLAETQARVTTERSQTNA